MTNEELKEWKQHPLTKQFFADLKEGKNKCALNALDLALTDPTEMAGKLGYEKGIYDTIESILNMEVVDDE